MTNMPLRYNISSWDQLSKVQSNNSRNLSIVVSKFIGRDQLNGECIRVVHSNYGVLFACVVGASGTLISEDTDGSVFELTPDQILKALAKYGFLVSYKPVEHLPGDQIDYLMNLDQLGFDKLRMLNVWTTVNGVKEFKLHIVAFNVKNNPQWINNGYSPSEEEFLDSVLNGNAIDITEISRTKLFNWSWLDFVANIPDIIKDNS